jgi:hypothetical protein
MVKTLLSPSMSGTEIRISTYHRRTRRFWQTVSRGRYSTWFRAVVTRCSSTVCPTSSKRS